ncbi:MAG: DUF3551 domain-containing protein [Hyphomicrobiales bacterium]|nr:DUF3551 domain-containing protein [Hyphomicrobiales bacterium]
MQDRYAPRSTKRPVVLALLIIGGCLCVGDDVRAQPSQRAPWCAYLGGSSSAYDCSYFTFEQCMATARGLGGFCAQNPRALAPARRPRSSRGYY